MELCFHGVTVVTKFHGNRMVVPHPSMRWMQIEPPQGIRRINLEIRAGAISKLDGILSFAVSGSRAKELRQTRLLSIPVHWQGTVPRTRQEGADNLDVILLETCGHFTDIQVGLVTRNTHFFVTAQQVYKGWIVGRRRQPGDSFWEVPYDFIPSDPIHAYPGCSYRGIWIGMAEEMIQLVRKQGTSQQRSRVLPKKAEWCTPIESACPPEWKSGVVLYFNLITGTGRIRDGHNQDYFVHFRSIPGADMTALIPMGRVRFKTKLEDATRVVAVQPA